MLNKYNSNTHVKNMMFIFILLVGDIIAYLVSLFFAYYTRIFADNFLNNTTFLFPFEYLINSLWWIPIIFILMLAYKNLYTLKNHFGMKASVFLWHV